MGASIADFYSGRSPDHRGRFLREIQQWPDDRLESVHDFIQWLFPLPEPSPVNPLAPTIDPATIAAFSTQPELRASLRGSFERMLRFYGFQMHAGPPVAVARAPEFAARSQHWLSPGNHNHLRITRILKCLTTLGLAEEARAFFQTLSQLYREEAAQPRPGITSVTFQFWQAAVERSL